MAGYSGTPLPRKLGIKPNAPVALIGAPEDFELTLDRLPEGASLHRDGRPADLSLWFVTSRSQLEGGIEAMSARAEGGGLWIAWPKKASGVSTDLSESVVRETGLAAGLVDFKICAIDRVWSGLRFSRRNAEGA